jgi:hypothetical protein
MEIYKARRLWKHDLPDINDTPKTIAVNLAPFVDDTCLHATESKEGSVDFDLKGQTQPLVREGTPQRQDNKFQTQTLEKGAIFGQVSTKWARLSAIKRLWL